MRARTDSLAKTQDALTRQQSQVTALNGRLRNEVESRLDAESRAASLARKLQSMQASSQVRGGATLQKRAAGKALQALQPQVGSLHQLSSGIRDRPQPPKHPLNLSAQVANGNMVHGVDRPAAVGNTKGPAHNGTSIGTQLPTPLTRSSGSSPPMTAPTRDWRSPQADNAAPVAHSPLSSSVGSAPTHPGSTEPRLLPPPLPPTANSPPAPSGLSTPSLQGDTPGAGTIALVRVALGQAHNDALTQFDRRDPMLTRSRELQFRSFAVAFAARDIANLGGVDVLKEMLTIWKCPNTWEIDNSTFQNKKFIRVVFTLIDHASYLFQLALKRFSLARCAGPLADDHCPSVSPPLPTLWKGSTLDAGFWDEEYPGLVVWHLPLGQGQAVSEVRNRLIARLKCDPTHFALFLDPQWVSIPHKSVAGKSFTKVKIFAHHASTARIISHDLKGNLDSEVYTATFSSGCEVCHDNSHAVWNCPKPKIRMRLSTPFNATFKNHLQSLLGNKGVGPEKLLKIWGGRSPNRCHQNKRFGYLAFSAKQHRDLAFSLLSSRWPGAESIVRPLQKVEKGLFKECPVCGSSSEEPPGYGISVHPAWLQKCPNRPSFPRRSFGVDLSLPDWQNQLPLFSNAPPGYQGARG